MKNLGAEASVLGAIGTDLDSDLIFTSLEEHDVKSIAEKVRNGELLPEQITEEDVSSALYPSDQMDVDLLIRTGGEYRISNFLLWQASYSELYFTPVLWPDFTEEELKKAVDWFEGRDRRFGGLTEET